MRIGILCLLGITLLGSRASAAPAATGDLLLDEPLTGGANAAKDTAGGVFEPDGWKPRKDDGYLYYELPAGLLTGTVEFEVKGIHIGMQGDPRKHPFLLSDVYLGPGAYYSMETATTLVLRVWTNPRQTSPAGKMRLRMIGPQYKISEREPKFQSDTPALAWDPERWYAMRIHWTQTAALFEVDGRPLLRVAYPDRQVALRHLFLNTGNYGKDMHGLQGVLYRNLRVTSPEAPALRARAAEPLTEAGPQDLQILPASLAGNQRLWHHLLDEAQRQFKARRTAFEESMLQPGGMARRQEALRAAYRANLGWLPGKTPLNPVVTHMRYRPGYRIENLAFESRPRHHVTANLYVPSGQTGPAPTVLLLCGHSPESKAAPAYQGVAQSLVRSGFVVLVPDPIAQGERLQVVSAQGGALVRGGTTSHTLLDGIGRLVEAGTVAHEVWDNIRALDYLETRPEVDVKRIGVTGTSGGGAMTTFLIGIEDRVQAAAVSCFINPRSVMFGHEGMYDGCAHLPGEGALGHDHADYLFMHAPKPVLILGAQKDYKDIAGVWQAYRDVKRGYTALGHPERAEIFESTDTHGFSPAHRRAAVRWLRRWLLGDDRPLVDPDLDPEPLQELLVTKTGQVATEWKDEVLQQDIYLERANALAAQRAKTWQSPAAALARVQQLAAIRTPGKTVAESRGAYRRTVSAARLRIERLVLRRERAVMMPALLVISDGLKGPARGIVYVDGRGNAAESGPGGEIERLARAGHVVLAVDVRGYGETADDPAANHRKFLNREFRTAMLAAHIGRPLIGQRAEDIIAAVGYLARRPGVDPSRIEIVGVGAAGPAALHAVAIDPRIAGLTLRRSLVSWVDLIAVPQTPHMLGQIVPGALAYYDLPDLVRAIAPRNVRITEPLTREALEAIGIPAGSSLTAAGVRAN